MRVITLAVYVGQHKATVWCLSVSLSVLAVVYTKRMPGLHWFDLLLKSMHNRSKRWCSSIIQPRFWRVFAMLSAVVVVQTDQTYTLDRREHLRLSSLQYTSLYLVCAVCIGVTRLAYVCVFSFRGVPINLFKLFYPLSKPVPFQFHSCVFSREPGG